jgi:NAD(P)-dependent dehydrogenase (short-subunit alcohol dehydrogenase family)
LDGHVAVITGGNGRLGSQYAWALSDAGAAVAVLDRVERPHDRIASLIADGARVSSHTVDVTSRAEVDAAIDRIAATVGTPTILVNNAGLGASPADGALETGRFEQYPESAWDAMLKSHLKSAVVASQSFIARFRADNRSDGSIINVSSTYGVVAPEQAVYDYRRADGAEYFKPVGYSVAKSGMLNFTRWLAEYCAHQRLGIRVNTLVPGGVREAGHDAAFVAEYEKRTPLGRMAREDDYNGAVLFLASRASTYMTGATLVVDGGWTAR